jgi:ComF family protein
LRAAVNFEGALRKAIHAFKYRGRRDLAAELAALMVESWNWRSYPIDVVVPVPLHPGRMALRGYNQATVLAEAFGCRVGIPIVPGKLVRDRDTVPQTRLAAVDRRTNVAGAFSVPPVERPFGKSVLLVDDVYTTGSTLRECGMALRTGGAKRGHDVGPRCVESTFRTDGRRANRAGMT